MQGRVRAGSGFGSSSPVGRERLTCTDSVEMGVRRTGVGISLDEPAAIESQQCH